MNKSRRAKSILVVVLAVVLVMAFAPTTALAATGAQDGISVELTTDKTSYNAGDTATVKASVTNTNNEAASGVKVDVTLPDGLSLATGQSGIDVGTLAAGETKTYTLTATAATAGGTSSQSPKTGDGSLFFLWIGIAAAAAVMIGVLVYKKKRTATKLLSLLLCLVLALSVMLPATTALAATIEKSFTVNESFAVGGVNKTLSAKITYSLNTTDHSVIDQPTGAIDPDSGKDAVFSFQGEYVNLAKVTLNGVDMGQTRTEGGAKILLSYPGYTGTAGDVVSGSVVITLYADFLKTLPDGVYTLTAVFNDGGEQNSGETGFTIRRDTIAVTGVTVAPKTATIAVGGTTQLTATVEPADATNKAVEWKSSDTAVATVGSASGLVKGISAGSATITATTADGGKTAACAVTVNEPSVSVTGVTLDADTASLSVGSIQSLPESQQLTATVAPGTATNKNVTWSSSADGVATVSNGGLVTAVAAGTATITVKTEDGDHTDTCTVTVGSLAASNAEAAKITGFGADSTSINTTTTLGFPVQTSSALSTGTTVQFVSTSVELGGSMNASTGQLSLNTANVVDASDLSSVTVTFTVTYNGVMSDQQNLDISSLFGPTTTAGKLRTDKAKIPTNGSAIGNFTFTTGTTNLNTYYSLTPAVTLSSGVAFSPVAGGIIGGGNPGISANQISLKADAGGDIQIVFAAAPTSTSHFNCRWQSNFVLTCDGTSYEHTNADFLVIFYFS